MGQRPGNSRNQGPLQPQASSLEFYKVLGVCCVLVVTVLLVYWQTSTFEMTVCDDDPYVYGNIHVIEGLSPKAWKSWEDNPLWWSLTTHAAGNWHPLTWMSHIIDGQLWGIHDIRFFGPGEPQRWKGPEAGGHHMTSVFLHAAAAVFLFLALRRLTASFWCSALVAAMFALHPLRAESVAWVAERKDVLSGLFWMLTLFAYGGYVQRPNVGRYLALIGVFALGLTAKSMLVTLPCVLLLLDVWPLRRWQPEELFPDSTAPSPSRFAPRPLWWLLVEKLPLFALAAIVSAIVAISQHGMGCMSMTDNVSWDCRIANAAYSAVAYLWKTIWPFNLAIFYPHMAVMGADEAARHANVIRLLWYGLGAAILLAAITAFVLWNLRRRPYLAVGWFWYLGALVPVVGLIQVGAQGMADRYTYLPTIGVYIMVVWGAAELAARSRELRLGLSVLAGIVLASWTALAAVQVYTWKTSETVFQHAIDVTNDNFFAHNHLGLAYQSNARQLESNARQLAASGQNDAAKAIAEEAKVYGADAGREFEEAVRTGPSYDAANANLGVYYMNKKDFDKALICFQKAVDVNPYAAFHHSNLAGVLSVLNRLKDAEVQLRKAIEIDPNTPRYRQYLAAVLFRQQKPVEAIAELDKVLDLSPNDAVTMKDIAWNLATSSDPSVRDGKKALELAERANEIAQDRDPVILSALAAAYAETGRFEEARDTASNAAALAARYNNKPLANFIRYTVSVYASGRPFREAPQPLPTSVAPSR